MDAVSDPITLSSLVELVFVIVLFLCWVKGLILSFRSNSPFLGIVCIFMPLVGVVIGVAAIVFKADIPALLDGRSDSGHD
ncbi:MAG: hypothetical protein H6677_00495 [Candidatus Obscuribacterales bacterium]|nr:hypothetical protein [Candidatus Obscuribacterales bacterium]